MYRLLFFLNLLFQVLNFKYNLNDIFKYTLLNSYLQILFLCQVSYKRNRTTITKGTHNSGQYSTPSLYISFGRNFRLAVYFTKEGVVSPESCTKVPLQSHYRPNTDSSSPPPPTHTTSARTELQEVRYRCVVRIP